MRHWLGAVALIAVAAPAMAQPVSPEERLQRQQTLEAQIRDMLRGVTSLGTESQDTRQGGVRPPAPVASMADFTRGEMMTVPLNSRGTKSGGEPSPDSVQGRAQPVGTAGNVVLSTVPIKPQGDAAARAAGQSVTGQQSGQQPPSSNPTAGGTTLSGSSRADLLNLGSRDTGIKRPGGNATGQGAQDDGAAFAIGQELRGNSGNESQPSRSTGNGGQGATLGGWQAQLLDGLLQAGEISRGQARELADAGDGRGAGGSGLFGPLSSQQLVRDLSRALAVTGLSAGAASQYVTTLRERGLSDTTSNFASETRVMQATDPWDDFVHYNANEVSVRPATALNGTTTATYNGRALGAFNGGETLDGKLKLNVDLAGGTLNGSLSFNGGANATLTGTASTSSLSINSIGGTGFGGVWEATMSGKYYGSRGQEVGGSWDLEVTSGARKDQTATGSFAAKQ